MWIQEPKRSEAATAPYLLVYPVARMKMYSQWEQLYRAQAHTTYNTHTSGYIDHRQTLKALIQTQTAPKASFYFPLRLRRIVVHYSERMCVCIYIYIYLSISMYVQCNSLHQLSSGTQCAQ